MSRSYRTVVLWALLVGLFVAFWKFFGARAPAGDASPSDGVWWSTFSQFLPITLLFLFFLFFMRRFRKNGVNNEGVALLNQGRYAEALERFEQFRQAQPKSAAAVFNSGVAKLSLWRLEGALADLRAAEQLGGGKEPALLALLPEHLALALALTGDVAGARRSLASLPAGKGDRGRIALAEAILLVRGGDAAAARQQLGSFEAKQLGGSLGGLARAVDAMCVEALSGELRHVDRVALHGEGGPDELRRAWPEFVAFVERAPAA